jgi:hypothetical protein
MRTLPTREQIHKGFEALDRDDEKAHLLCATSGLRKTEAWKLREVVVSFSTRCVKPKHGTRTKRAGVSLCNAECTVYIDKLKFKNGKVFHIDERLFRAM